LCLGYKGVRDFVRKMDYCVKLPYSFIGAASASLSLEVISEKSPKAKNAFRDFPEMLVGPDQPASAFLVRILIFLDRRAYCPWFVLLSKV
jgi:hypothetical protein